MKFSYLWLKEIAGFKETPQKLAEMLTLRSFEIESVEKVGNDYALDVKITPNRFTDAASHLGLAREIAAIMNIKYREQTVKLPKSAEKFTITLRILPPELCSRYTAQILEIPQNIVSPDWMARRLATCGLRPINAVVDMTNYIMLETGHPLHAFDFESIRGKSITIRSSQEGEEVVTLDGVKRILPDNAIIIEDTQRIIDLAGIMGGKNSEILEETKTILLQAAVFDSTRIYKTSHALGLSSAASKLYAAGVDSSASLAVLERATLLLEQIAHAKRAGATYDWYPQKISPRKIFFRSEYADSVIGYTCGASFYQRIFSRLGLIIKKRGDNMVIQVPPARRDLLIEEDLIEEAARIFGYEHIPAQYPKATIAPSRQNDEVYWADRIRDLAVATGYTEVEVYEFIGAQELEQFSYQQQNLVALKNPMSPETAYLIPRVLINYISAVKENLKYANNVQLFGMGKSFTSKNGKVEEQKDLIFCYSAKGANGHEEFYVLKGLLDSLFDLIGITDYSYNDKEVPDQRSVRAFFHPYRVAEIKINQKKIGIIGEIHPTILQTIRTKSRIVAVELNFEALWHTANAEQQYHPIGKYPSIRRDIAILVPFNTKTEEILNVVETAGGQFLVDTDLFDYFQDEAMQEAETKSIAFHLIFESPERTLKDEEINIVITHIITALENQGWDVKK